MCWVRGRGRIDLALVFARSARQLGPDAERVARRLAPNIAMWLAWPKRGTPEAGDLDEGFVRDRGLPAGLVDVKVCAIGETWSALKFVRRLADRSSSRTGPLDRPALERTRPIARLGETNARGSIDPRRPGSR